MLQYRPPGLERPRCWLELAIQGEAEQLYIHNCLQCELSEKSFLQPVFAARLTHSVHRGPVNRGDELGPYKTREMLWYHDSLCVFGHAAVGR